MKFCSKCGTQLEDGIALCPECGSPVTTKAISTGSVKKTASFARHEESVTLLEPDSKTKQSRMTAFVISLISDAYLLIFLLTLCVGDMIFNYFNVNVTGIQEDVFKEAAKHAFSDPILVTLIIILIVFMILVNIIPLIVHKNKWSYLFYKNRDDGLYGKFDTVFWTLFYFIGPSTVYSIIMRMNPADYIASWSVTGVEASSLFYILTIVGFVLACLKMIFNSAVSEKSSATAK